MKNQRCLVHCAAGKLSLIFILSTIVKTISQNQIGTSCHIPVWNEIIIYFRRFKISNDRSSLFDEGNVIYCLVEMSKEYHSVILL
jgi:hypothetical protein